MKRNLLLTILLILSAITLRAQTKTPETKPSKPTYRKVVVMPIEDWQTLTQQLNESQRLTIYDGRLTADQRIQTQQAIDAYLKDLPTRIRLDSVAIVEPKKK